MDTDTVLPARIGRPSKAEQILTPDVLEQVAWLLVEGNFKETVCDFLGIDRSTWWRWEQIGEREPGSIYAEFCNVVKKAQAGAEISLLRSIRYGVEGWQSRAWMMERRFPQRWGRRAEITLRVEAEKLAREFGVPVETVLQEAERAASEASGAQ